MNDPNPVHIIFNNRHTPMKVLAGGMIFFLPLFNAFSFQPADTTAAARRVKIAGYPAVGYAPETSLQLGAVGIFVIKPRPADSVKYYRPASVSPYFLFTFRKQLLSAIEVELFPDNRYFLNTTFRYFNYPDLYFETGPVSTAKSESYTDRFLKIDGKASMIIHNKIFPGITYEWQYNSIQDITEGGMLDTAGIPGTGGGNLLGIGPYFRMDTRNNVLYPSHGVFLESHALFFPAANLNDYSFTAFSVDLRTFSTLFSEKNIFAFQAIYQFADGNSVPFYKLPRLGGDSRLRGIEHENRYRNHHAFYMQVEGRRHLFWRLGGVLFAGAGDVTDHLSDFNFSSLKYVFGIGGRFQPIRDELLNLRLDIGKGPGKQFAIYLSVREAF